MTYIFNVIHSFFLPKREKSRSLEIQLTLVGFWTFFFLEARKKFFLRSANLLDSLVSKYNASIDAALVVDDGIESVDLQACKC